MTPEQVYSFALQVTLAEEGGFSDHPADKGGATMKGVTAKTYVAYRVGKGLGERSVREIEDDELHEIYYSYWTAVRADTLPPALAVVVFDVAINSGAARALQWLAERPHDHVSFTAHRLAYFTSLTNWLVFGRGWTRRAARVLEAAHKLSGVTSSESGEMA